MFTKCHHSKWEARESYQEAEPLAWTITVNGKRTGATKREVQDKIAALIPNPERRKAKQEVPTLAELSEQLLKKYDPEGSTYRTYGIALAHW